MSGGFRRPSPSTPPLNWSRSKAPRPLLARASFPPPLADARRRVRSASWPRPRAAHQRGGPGAPHGISGWRLGACNGPGTAIFRRLVGGATWSRASLTPRLPRPRKSSHLTAPPRGPQQSNRDQHAPPAAAPLVAPRDGCKLIAGEAAFRLCPRPTEAGGSSAAFARHAPACPGSLVLTARSLAGLKRQIVRMNCA